MTLRIALFLFVAVGLWDRSCRTVEASSPTKGIAPTGWRVVTPPPGASSPSQQPTAKDLERHSNTVANDSRRKKKRKKRKSSASRKKRTGPERKLSAFRKSEGRDDPGSTLDFGPPSRKRTKKKKRRKIAKGSIPSGDMEKQTPSTLKVVPFVEQEVLERLTTGQEEQRDPVPTRKKKRRKRRKNTQSPAVSEAKQSDTTNPINQKRLAINEPREDAVLETLPSDVAGSSDYEGADVLTQQHAYSFDETEKSAPSVIEVPSPDELSSSEADILPRQPDESLHEAAMSAPSIIEVPLPEGVSSDASARQHAESFDETFMSAPSLIEAPTPHEVSSAESFDQTAIPGPSLIKVPTPDEVSSDTAVDPASSEALIHTKDEMPTTTEKGDHEEITHGQEYVDTFLSSDRNQNINKIEGEIFSASAVNESTVLLSGEHIGDDATSTEALDGTSALQEQAIEGQVHPADIHSDSLTFMLPALTSDETATQALDFPAPPIHLEVISTQRAEQLAVEGEEALDPLSMGPEASNEKERIGKIEEPQPVQRDRGLHVEALSLGSEDGPLPVKELAVTTESGLSRGSLRGEAETVTPLDDDDEDDEDDNGENASERAARMPSEPEAYDSKKMDMEVESGRPGSGLESAIELVHATGVGDAGLIPRSPSTESQSLGDEIQIDDLRDEINIDDTRMTENDESDLIVSVVTWNLAEESPAEEDAAFIRQFRNLGDKRDKGSDIVLISGQECENIKPRRSEGRRSREFRRLMVKMLGKKYVPIALHLLGGIQFGLFCKRSRLGEIKHASVADVTCGIGNVFHNKGAIGAFVTMKARQSDDHDEGIDDRSKSVHLLFIAAHMAAHVKNTEARNSDFWRIVSELEAQAPERFLLPKTENAVQGTRLLESSDRIFFCGDLNYRIDVPRETADHALTRMLRHLEAGDAGSLRQAESIRRGLLRHDQLLRVVAEEKVFPGFAEGRVTFLPTFKYDKGTDEYDTSHKQRIPAWTDRVLFKPSGTRVLEYNSIQQARHSDHRPVYATFRVSLKGRDATLHKGKRKTKKSSNTRAVD